MDQNLKEIRLGEGLGTLKFGATRDDVKALLGKPDETERYNLSEEEGDESEDWHYDARGISLSFEEVYDWRLASIAVSGDGFTLNNKALVGMETEAVLDTVEAMGFDQPEEDEVIAEEDSSQALYHVDEQSLSLYFENDTLTEIQWGPLLDEDSEEPQWPE